MFTTVLAVGGIAIAPKGVEYHSNGVGLPKVDEIGNVFVNF